MKNLLLVACVVIAVPFSVVAGPMGSACMQSDRAAASRTLCKCIDRVADKTLRWADQRRAAKFFRDPDKAHEVWISQSKSDDAFWERYLQFGAAAEASCSG